MYLVIGVLAAVENVFPPLPSDTAVALGAFLSATGEVSAVGVFLVTWMANVAGAAGVYVVARWVGRPFARGRVGRRLMPPATLERLERLYDVHGTWSIFLSRFIPGVRAVVPPFAAVAGLGIARTLVPVVAASAIWYGTITFLVVRFVGEIQDVVRFMDHLNAVTVVVAAGGVVVAVALLLVRRRTTRARRKIG